MISYRPVSLSVAYIINGIYYLYEKYLNLYTEIIYWNLKTLYCPSIIKIVIGFYCNEYFYKKQENEGRDQLFTHNAMGLFLIC